jgi:small-conductance mechanosensitive channel
MIFFDMPTVGFAGGFNALTTLFLIAIFAIIAYVAHRSSRRLAHYFASASRFTLRNRDNIARQAAISERRKTIESIFSGIISLTAVLGAILATLSLFVSLDSLLWMIGLFSAAFGLGARPFISDVLTGIAIVFDNTFTVGEKVLFPDVNVEGVVEQVALRTTQVRAPTGELFIIPNGDVRTVRNFSRGLFSQVRLALSIPINQLERAITELESLSEEAMLSLPNLIEPWIVLSEDELGQNVNLILLAKARHGRAAEMKPRLDSLVNERLANAGIHLGGG